MRFCIRDRGVLGQALDCPCPRNDENALRTLAFLACPLEFVEMGRPNPGNAARFR